jgi:DNA-binding NtrC family response regulator
MTLDVFLSYAPSDEPIAREVAESFQGRGLRCWLAAGNNYADKPPLEGLPDAVRQAHLFLLLLSPSSLQSQQIDQQVQDAIRSGMDVLTVKSAELDPKLALSPLLRGLTQLDASEPPIAAHLDRLAEAVKFALQDAQVDSPKSGGAPAYRLLIVDDDEQLRQTLARRFKKQGIAVTVAGSGEEALLRTERAACDVGLLDLHLPGMDGIELFRRLKDRQPDQEVLMLTGNSTIESAIQAMKQGAYDYLTKPFHLPELEVHVQKAFEKVLLSRRERQWLDQSEAESARLRLVGSSPAMQRVLRLIDKVAPTDTTVLVCGETGTGKELVARALHRSSARRHRPLVTAHCTGPDGLTLERELFGHEEKTSGELRAERGLIEMAEGGTLFLDEVSEMALGTQAKLLRLLEGGSYRRVGGTVLCRADVRLVVATDRDLTAQITAGQFREDLYYRLNVISLNLPPLRERLADVKDLVEHLLESRRLRSSSCQVTPEALAALQRYPWPGNVRELANVLERAQILAVGPAITPADLPEVFIQEPLAGASQTGVPPPTRLGAGPFVSQLRPQDPDDQFSAELQQLRGKLPGLAEELTTLEHLLGVDVPSSLNKTRFITEQALLRLCAQHGVSWGDAEPTLERMIGPLICSGKIPRSIAIYVRTIQASASPGSHPQDPPLSGAHVRIALAALVEFLRWSGGEDKRGGDRGQGE